MCVCVSFFGCCILFFSVPDRFYFLIFWVCVSVCVLLWKKFTIYIRLFPLLEPPPFVSAFVSGYTLLTVALFDLFGDCGGLDAFELPLAKNARTCE